ncbi:hypothetical protein Lepto7376_0736 [[Leptolyngbya] sp. PCC 7376]|uniref:molybdopterin-dependent oxidoreductase n=1 Tax=[Leptolyngbya] sp. PCC 7376 TaxID=111781 RepID=UPI00029F26B5|nr:molybdopterin-dependent oxidoreductase [[Leptolyngbya] sp. PCC 7376]AFY37134.1 hypothetical protein Lepto7376_0736 [[Leptolyngbya] sp. PCC 7376]
MIFLRKIAALAIAFFLLTSCTPEPQKQQPMVTIIRPADFVKQEAIPLPETEPILTVTGKIQATNQDEALYLDRQTIEQLQIVEYKIFDLFENQQVTFEGVLFNDLMDLWQIQPDATLLEIKALNDYTISVPIQTTREIPILFALKQEGRYMERNYRGPAMLIVPPFENKPEIEITRQAFWIRQIESISVS